VLDWGDLRYLLAVHHTGSHARAGRALGVDATTVARRVRALENALGSRLVERIPGGRGLTASGRAILPDLRRVEAQVAALERRSGSKGGEVSGLVRVTAGDGMMHHLLIPALPALRERHPGLTIELVSDVQVRDLVRREADVAVRLVRPTAPALVARRLAPLDMGIYAGTRYLADRRPPATLRDLADHDWLEFPAELHRMPQARWLRGHVAHPRIVLRANTSTALLEACAAGVGLAVLGTRFCAHDPRLQRLLPRVPVPSRQAWLVMHGDARRSARIAAVVDWLVRVLA
jgi:molybdate transport repressor ModE-like protein